MRCAVIQLSEGGIPAIVAGIPVHYIHSPTGITSYFDFEATVKFAGEIISSTNESIIRTL